MNLAFMNKIRYWIIVLLSVATNVCKAQSFKQQHEQLVEQDNDVEMIKLLHKHEDEFLKSGLIGKFAYHINLAILQFNLKDYPNATRSLAVCSHVLEEIESSDLELLKSHKTTPLAKYFYLIGMLNFISGHNQLAEENLLECYNVLFARADHEQLELFRNLHVCLGELYLVLNNIPNAFRYLSGAKIGSEANLLFDQAYCRGLIMLGTIYIHQENYLKAKMYLDEVAYTIDSNHGMQNIEDDFMVRGMLCSCYMKMGYKNDAKRIALAGITECEKLGITDERLAFMYTSLGEILFSMEDYVSAKAIFKKAYNIAQKDKSMSKDDLSLYSSNLSTIQFLTNDLKYKRTISELSTTIIDDVLRQFSFLSSDERARYWDRKSDELNKYNAMLFLSGEHPYYEQVYNNTIFAKGLLLRAASHISEQLAVTEDNSLREDATRLHQLQTRIINEELTSEELVAVKDSIRKIEKTLSVKLIGYQSTDSIRKKFDYQTVRRALNENEAAIEFIKLPELTFGADTLKEYYAAIIFKGNDKHPQIVRLCDESSLAEVQIIPDAIKNSKMQENAINELYRQYLYGKGDFTKTRLGGKKVKFRCVGDSLYQMLWKPIEAYLHEVTSVYYSTTGQLNAIAMGAIPIDSTTLSEKYSLCYLSSTSEIPYIKTASNVKPATATLYGGINYDTSADEMQAQSRGYNRSAAKGYFASNIDRGERGSWGYLEGSEKEAVDISAQLDSAHIANKFFTASFANEESFKAASGHSPNLFHIATHGFFYPDEKDRGVQNFLRGIKGLDNVNHIQASMSRAGIIFSGANRAWSGEKIDENIEDGILTAEEISHLDLSNTDMVVLSACETGLGKDVSTEGVFGLQRAFKLAGVQTLVMSLWKVPDTETSQLMQLFYNYWLGGMEKHKAFQEAQKRIKSQKPNPYYWAGFVMLD